jgi:hypothetical protein
MAYVSSTKKIAFYVESACNSSVLDVYLSQTKIKSTTKTRNQKNIMSLILSNNKVTLDELAAVSTPAPTENHFPIPHIGLVDAVRDALTQQNYEILEEEHALARKGQRYFGGFAVTSPDVAGERRRLVVGVRNSHDKAFAAALVLGNQMMVCENLCFSSEVKLGRKHTKFIERDLPSVIAKAVARLSQNWLNMEERIKAYESTTVDESTAYKWLVHLVDVKALTSQKLYHACELFRAPEIAALGMVEQDGKTSDEYKEALGLKQAELLAEFGDGSLWTLYNAFTECLKGGDLSKLPQRTMIAQAFFDAQASFSPVVNEELEEVNVEPAEQEAAFVESFGEAEVAAVEASQE